MLPLVLIVSLYHLLKGGHDKYKRILRFGIIYIVGLLIPILPVTVRNPAVADDAVLISAQGRANFYIGNSRYADSLTVVMPLAGAVFEGGEFDDNIHSQSVSLAKKAYGRDVRESEVSSYWYRQALSDMVADPARTALLLAKKALYFWHGQEIFNNKSLYYAGEYSALMGLAIWKTDFFNFPSGLLFPLMFIGVVFALRQKTKFVVPLAYIGIYSIVVIMFFVCARFRQPIVPVAIILASYGIIELYQTIRKRKRDGYCRCVYSSFR